MLLTIDIGNTNIFAGVFKGANILSHWRMATAKNRTADEYGIMMLGLLSNAGIKKTSITGCAIACVVPQLKGTFLKTATDYIGVKPLIVEPGVKTGMPIITDNPHEVGADRIITSVAAYNIYRTSLIVVDFGTAITFDYVTGKGEYAGGAISPGITISAEALFEKAARLQKVEISKPLAVIGKNTTDSLKSGIFYGFAGLVQGIVERMKAEARDIPKHVIATGGYAGIVANEIKAIDGVDEFLVLKGLKIIHEVNR